MGFTPAVRKKRKARIAISGPTGSGKTFTALTLAQPLADGGKIALLDTEGGRALDYADIFTYDHDSLGKPYSPARYIQAIHEAERAGYAVLVIDSLSHAWFAEGGVLDIVDKEASRNRGNKYKAWEKGTPAQNSLVEAILASPLHIITTMRAKMAYEVIQEEQNGRIIFKGVKKIGLAPVQRNELEYEFSIWAEMDQDHRLMISKSTISHLQDAVIDRPGIELGQQIHQWLTSPNDSTTDDNPSPKSLPTPTAKTQPESTASPEAAVDPAATSQPKPAPEAQKDLARMHALGSSLGMDHEEVRSFAANVISADLDSLKDLTAADRKTVLAGLQRNINELEKAKAQRIHHANGDDGYSDRAGKKTPFDSAIPPAGAGPDGVQPQAAPAPEGTPHETLLDA